MRIPSEHGTADWATQRHQNAEDGHALRERGLTRCPGGKSLNSDGPGDTSGAGLSDPEEPFRRGWRKDMPSTVGLSKFLGDPGGEVATADAFTRGAVEEGHADRDAGRRGSYPSAAQQTGQL
ncbi:hypothetical protein NDU88_005494 [Pleurodeles waltl]|uniref:Uncharacterized protein n=1 Tax=Pleurodeles waltl TaxID=8319 RepID=A0AAV7TXF1_PLEWA|nr:hypothetical protein NDU88_005494 [Pleurodeles waltl]